MEMSSYVFSDYLFIFFVHQCAYNILITILQAENSTLYLLFGYFALAVNYSNPTIELLVIRQVFNCYFMTFNRHWTLNTKYSGPALLPCRHQHSVFLLCPLFLKKQFTPLWNMHRFQHKLFSFISLSELLGVCSSPALFQIALFVLGELEQTLSPNIWGKNITLYISRNGLEVSP